MDWLAGAIEIWAGFLLGYKYKSAFLFNIIGAFLWIYVAITMEVYGLMLVAIPMVTINAKNYWMWWKDE